MSIYHIFCDESRQTNHRYMVLGALIIEQEEIDKFNKTMLEFRDKTNMHDELKWSKVSNGKKSEYLTLIDYFFALNNTDMVHFHSVVFDTHQINHKKYSGDYEKGFYKFFYQLLYNCCAKNYLQKDNKVRFIIHMDHRNTSYRLNDLKDILNNAIKKHLDISEKRILSVQAVDSKKSDLTQMADIILGSIGYQQNGYHLISGSSKIKIEIAEYIAKKAGLINLINNTKYGIVRFKIWIFRFSKK